MAYNRTFTLLNATRRSPTLILDLRLPLYYCSDMTNVRDLFSAHLFWDTDEVDPERNAVWLCQRVLEYGELSDWRALIQLYGKPRIRNAVQQMRTLRDKPRNFACCVLNLDESTLRCYKNKQSQNHSWPY